MGRVTDGPSDDFDPDESKPDGLYPLSFRKSLFLTMVGPLGPPLFALSRNSGSLLLELPKTLPGLCYKTPNQARVLPPIEAFYAGMRIYAGWSYTKDGFPYVGGREPAGKKDGFG